MKEILVARKTRRALFTDMSDNSFENPPETPPGPPPAPVVTPTPAAVSATPPWPEGAATQDERTMAMLAHLLGIPTGFLGPLIIWLVKKDQSAFVEVAGREALNFHLTLFLISVVLFPALLILSIIPLLGCLVLPLFFLAVMAFGIGSLVIQIIAAIKANEGQAYRYPVNFRLIR